MTPSIWLKSVLIPFWTIEFLGWLALLGFGVFSFTTLGEGSYYYQDSQGGYFFYGYVGGVYSDGYYGIYKRYYYSSGDYASEYRRRRNDLLGVNAAFFVAEVLMTALLISTFVMLGQKRLPAVYNLSTTCVRCFVALFLFLWSLFQGSFLAWIINVIIFAATLAQVIYDSVVMHRVRKGGRRSTLAEPESAMTTIA